MEARDLHGARQRGLPRARGNLRRAGALLVADARHRPERHADRGPGAPHVGPRALRPDRTLWCGFVLSGPSGSVYFAGDTGWGSHFGPIGEAFPNLRLAILRSAAFSPAGTCASSTGTRRCRRGAPDPRRLDLHPDALRNVPQCRRRRIRAGRHAARGARQGPRRRPALRHPRQRSVAGRSGGRRDSSAAPMRSPGGESRLRTRR